MEGRERFVPLRVGQLTAALAEGGWPSEAERDAFRSFSRMVSALYHFEFHDREQVVVAAWEEIEHDAGAGGTIAEELRGLLLGANYVEVTGDELRTALDEESLLPLRLEVDLDDYEELLIYRRGSRTETVEVQRWKGLRHEQRTVTVEDRVVVLAQVKPKAWFDERGIDPSERNLSPDQLSLKEFQRVPRADIEMLLPSTQVRFRLVDSLLVGVPAVASGVLVLTTKLLPTLGLIFVLVGAWIGVRNERPELDQGALVALIGGLVALGGFLIRQWTKLKNRRLSYLKTLSETLYFRTLADGPGVLHILLAAAEQQEVIEVLLAYRFLLDAPEGLTGDELDATVERWLDDTCQRDVDFEVDDAVTKLRSMELVAHDTPRLVAIPLDDALARLDRRWDDLFRHQPDDAVVPVTKH